MFYLLISSVEIISKMVLLRFLKDLKTERSNFSCVLFPTPLTNLHNPTLQQQGKKCALPRLKIFMAFPLPGGRPYAELNILGLNSTQYEQYRKGSKQTIFLASIDIFNDDIEYLVSVTVHP